MYGMYTHNSKDVLRRFTEPLFRFIHVNTARSENSQVQHWSFRLCEMRHKKVLGAKFYKIINRLRFLLRMAVLIHSLYTNILKAGHLLEVDNTPLKLASSISG